MVALGPALRTTKTHLEFQVQSDSDAEEKSVVKRALIAHSMAQPASISSLPDDVLVVIFSLLNSASLRASACVCSAWTPVARHALSWQPLVQHRLCIAPWAASAAHPRDARVAPCPLLSGGVPLWQLLPLMPRMWPTCVRTAFFVAQNLEAVPSGESCPCVRVVRFAGPLGSDRAVVANTHFPTHSGVGSVPFVWAPPVSAAQRAGDAAPSRRSPSTSAAHAASVQFLAGAYMVAYFEVTIGSSSCNSSSSDVPPCTPPTHLGSAAATAAAAAAMDAARLSTVAVGLAGYSFPLSRRQPGWDAASFGWHGDDGRRFHCAPHGTDYGPRFGVGDTVGCGVVYAPAPLTASPRWALPALSPLVYVRTLLHEQQQRQRAHQPCGVGEEGSNTDAHAPQQPAAQVPRHAAASPLVHSAERWGALPLATAAAEWPTDAGNTIFFTLNGRLCGPAFSHVDLSRELFPAVGIDSHAVLRFNFGTCPGEAFRFDVRRFNAELLRRAAFPVLPHIPAAAAAELSRAALSHVLPSSGLTVAPPPPLALRGSPGGSASSPGADRTPPKLISVAPLPELEADTSTFVEAKDSGGAADTLLYNSDAALLVASPACVQALVPPPSLLQGHSRGGGLSAAAGDPPVQSLRDQLMPQSRARSSAGGVHGGGALAPPDQGEGAPTTTPKAPSQHPSDSSPPVPPCPLPRQDGNAAGLHLQGDARSWLLPSWPWPSPVGLSGATDSTQARSSSCAALPAAAPVVLEAQRATDAPPFSVVETGVPLTPSVFEQPALSALQHAMHARMLRVAAEHAARALDAEVRDVRQERRQLSTSFVAPSDSSGGADAAPAATDGGTDSPAVGGGGGESQAFLRKHSHQLLRRWFFDWRLAAAEPCGWRLDSDDDSDDEDVADQEFLDGIAAALAQRVAQLRVDADNERAARPEPAVVIPGGALVPLQDEAR